MIISIAGFGTHHGTELPDERILEAVEKRRKVIRFLN